MAQSLHSPRRQLRLLHHPLRRLSRPRRLFRHPLPRRSPQHSLLGAAIPRFHSGGNVEAMMEDHGMISVAPLDPTAASKANGTVSASKAPARQHQAQLPPLPNRAQALLRLLLRRALIPLQHLLLLGPAPLRHQAPAPRHPLQNAPKLSPLGGSAPGETPTERMFAAHLATYVFTRTLTIANAALTPMLWSHLHLVAPVTSRSQPGASVEEGIAIMEEHAARRQTSASSPTSTTVSASPSHLHRAKC